MIIIPPNQAVLWVGGAHLSVFFSMQTVSPN